MDRDYVESSMITSFGFESSACILEIEFKSGVIWQYYDFPESEYYELKSCDSCGKFFNARIKGKYSESQVG